ncbi:hypothetical protein DMH04_11670 [Kibdelosporangium aridum]|uniref:Uncharacterized protein n=1 Tax=Kibdelosporangium aridum TaxID=2030 RepID=A0A428ZFQ0_KIBAR|nr:hypothetical protein DMH04_11670 [Kibdelosporangium aridum]
MTDLHQPASTHDNRWTTVVYAALDFGQPGFQQRQSSLLLPPFAAIRITPHPATPLPTGDLQPATYRIDRTAQTGALVPQAPHRQLKLIL